MCSWGVNSVVDYYNRAGRAVYACALDLSKAFDLVSWEVLFSELLEMGVSPLALWCLMFIYSNQKFNVRWGNAFSNTFNVQNGVRQGAVSSPLLFCIYIDKVIKLLRCLTIGCQILGAYMGIWVYADDIILLFPSKTGLQEMVKICKNFAKATKLKFSTNIRIENVKLNALFFLKKGLIIMK